MKKSKIYTKTGDFGTSSLYTGEVMDKNDMTFEALGCVDEVNSALGLVISIQALVACMYDDLKAIIVYLQSRLIDIGSCLATPTASEDLEKLARVHFPNEHIEKIEEYIDLLDNELPQLTQFILPSGGECSARLHMTRSICRRAERCVVSLNKRENINSAVLIFLNRLSDLIFVMARTCASRDGIAEVPYKKAK